MMTMLPRTAGDADLVRRAMIGEDGAFAVLADRYRGDAYRVARSVVGRHEDAEDVTQESLLVALDQLEKCGIPERFAGWLMTIVRNRSLNLLRNESLRATEELPLYVPCTGTPPPDRAVEASELWRILEEVLATLPETRRRTFVMHDVEGWNDKEIAEMLGLKRGTVRSHLWHARTALRARLSPDRRPPE